MTLLYLLLALAPWGSADTGEHPVPATPTAVPCLDGFLGTWRGRGVVLGRAIVMEQQWARALSGAFVELRMRHLATDTSTVAGFEGRGFYRTPVPPSDGRDSVTGHWFDARGVAFPVAGVCSGGIFMSAWGDARERGRTVYSLRGDSLVVIDSVHGAAGGREFGRSTLRRLP